MLLLHQNIAAGLIRYRLNRVPGAEFFAKRTNLTGARFPWESAFTGRNVCPKGVDTCLQEIHVNGDIACVSVCVCVFCVRSVCAGVCLVCVAAVCVALVSCASRRLCVCFSHAPVALLNVVLLWVGYNSFALRQFWWLTGNTTWLQSVAKPIVSG